MVLHGRIRRIWYVPHVQSGIHLANCLIEMCGVPSFLASQSGSSLKNSFVLNLRSYVLGLKVHDLPAERFPLER